MISFIVIGKNIEHTVRLCINSIINCADKCKIPDYEIIYVDSKSTDNTLSIVKDNYFQVRAISVIGETNAAIGRNIGAKESKGEYLIFLDGDMELQVEFMQAVLDEKKNLKYEFVSGNIVYYFYDENWNYLKNNAIIYQHKEDHLDWDTLGGAFGIRKGLWIEMDAMNTKYTRGEDIDLLTRLTKRGYPLLRKKEMMAIHHTVSYFHKKRFYSMVFDGGFLYPGVFIREHLFNIRIIKLFIRYYFTAIFLFTTLVCCIFKMYYLIPIYAILIIVRTLLRKHKENRSIIFHIYARFIYDSMFVAGFLFFYPKRKKINYL